MRLRHHIKWVIAVLVVLGSCKKPYNPPVIETSNNYLVVEGIINTSIDSSIIKLSRTVKLSDQISSKAETGAEISVGSDGGVHYIMVEISPGIYMLPALDLNTSLMYTIRISTKDGEQYESDKVAVKASPPIDKVNYVVKDNGIQINVSTHDPDNNTHYYRWAYDEDWRFHAKYLSSFQVLNNEVVPRRNEDNVYYCFGNNRSSSIVIGSSTKLAQDVIADAPVTEVSSTSQKISLRYSILVKQYALTKDAYEFWENLKKNTEQLGSIFDALPSQLIGNIHNVKDPKEPVIGYFSVGNAQTKRIFIDKKELPPTWNEEYPEDCTQDTSLLFNPISGVNEVAAYILSNQYVPTADIVVNSRLKGYLRTTFQCADCTLTGTKKQPDFWK